MRKALIPMVASLALCGAGTAALIASNSHAQASPRKPVMVALLGDPLMAQNLPDTPPPPNAMGASRDFAPDPGQFCDALYAALAPDQRQTLAPPRPMMGRDHGPMPPRPEGMSDLPPPPAP